MFSSRHVCRKINNSDGPPSAFEQFVIIREICRVKSFDVPIIYRSPLISAIKNKRRQDDRMKKDFQPTLLDFGPLRIYLARHFGFCYGVENAIEIAFRTIAQNPGKRIFLLSEMIHNPHVNADLLSHGIRFLQAVATRWPRTMRILLTGMGDTDSSDEARASGAIHRVLAKPCPADELKAVIAEAMRGSAG